jgi:hypothetical protein
VTSLAPISSATPRDQTLAPAAPSQSQQHGISQDPTSHFQPISQTEQPSTGEQHADTAHANKPDPNHTQDTDANTNADGDSASFSSAPSSAPGKLTPEEQEKIQKLQSRDAEVRTHEAAHMAGAGAHARGGPSYSYQTGPDGKRYAVGGHVSIDTSPANSPEATIAKAAQIRAAALAPADPSSADRSVAAIAVKMESKARAELAKESQTERSETGRPETERSEAEQPETEQSESAEQSTVSPAAAPVAYDTVSHNAAATPETPPDVAPAEPRRAPLDVLG